MFIPTNTSCVTCHVSQRVMCHVSRITCHMSHVIFFIFLYFFFGQSGESYLWRVCYQRGLPRLVFFFKYKLSYQTLTDIVMQ